MVSAAQILKKKQLQIVDIAALEVSSDPGVSLITYALGSCIAVVVHDPARQIGGMIHYMLPLSKVSPPKAASKPAMFADLGIPILFKQMYALGCDKKSLVIKVAGGAALYDDKGTFNIGKRNITIMRKMLWKNGILIRAEDLGGNISRTVRLEVGSGDVWIKTGGRETQL